MDKLAEDAIDPVDGVFRHVDRWIFRIIALGDNHLIIIGRREDHFHETAVFSVEHHGFAPGDEEAAVNLLDIEDSVGFDFRLHSVAYHPDGELCIGHGRDHHLAVVGSNPLGDIGEASGISLHREERDIPGVFFQGSFLIGIHEHLPFAIKEPIAVELRKNFEQSPHFISGHRFPHGADIGGGEAHSPGKLAFVYFLRLEESLKSLFERIHGEKVECLKQCFCKFKTFLSILKILRGEKINRFLPELAEVGLSYVHKK